MKKVRTGNPLLLSIGIHLAFIALFFGIFSVVRTAIPIPAEKITLKILTHVDEPIPSISAVQPAHTSVKIADLIAVPKPQQPITLSKTPVLVQSKPTVVAPQTLPMSAPVAVPKNSEATSIAVPKTPPPPQKVQENYEEENLGRIRSILAERLKYPKNALRLKQQGESIVTFTLETNREVSQIIITQSSGFELLDDAAKNLIESSANEFPKPAKTVRISVPIAYKLR